MKRIQHIVLLGILLLAATACGERQKALLPSVSGKAGEVIVVMTKGDWEGNLGSETRDLLASDCPWLATKEPLYSLVSVIPTAFTDIFRIHRNIVFFDINPQVAKSGVVYRKDMWSSPQCVIQISAVDADEAIGLLHSDGEMILTVLEQAERDRVIGNTLLYEERSLAPQVREIFGGSPHFPMGYSLKKKTSDFVWIADEKQYTNQAIFVYKYPADENPFTEDNIIRHRNEVMKANVPGMFENTYMTTSEYIQPTVTYMTYKGRSFAQCRGYWEVYNDYMGGPFVSHSFYSEDGKDIIVLEAFVYAPRYDKRQYLRQVESLLYSFEWEKTKE